MKPVNLLPGDAPVVAAAPGKPNLGAIGAMAAGVLALIVIAGVFAMGRVDSVKSETAAAAARSEEATAKTAATRSQIESLGQPVVDTDKQLAQGAETVLVAAYAERHDFVQLSRELRAIMEGTGGWYVSVEAASVGGDTTKSVEVSGYMRTKELVASFNERANATRSLSNAETVSIESERLTDLDTKRPGVYYKFTMTADLDDTVAPSAGGASSAGGSVDGTTVADGGGAGEELRLSLDPTPAPPKPAPTKVKAEAKPKAAPKAPAQPKNPFDVAVDVAGGGTS